MYRESYSMYLLCEHTAASSSLLTKGSKGTYNSVSVADGTYVCMYCTVLRCDSLDKIHNTKKTEEKSKIS